MNDILIAALDWLERGAFVLPAQPGSKSLAKGYGPNLRSIKRPSEAYHYFNSHKSSNIAVVCLGDLLALDFDDYGVLTSWLERIPTKYLATRSEISPRGEHFFYRCHVPEGLRLVAGVEIKRVVLVAPSKVGDFQYRCVDSSLPIMEVDDWREILSSLLSEEESIHLPHQAGTEKIPDPEDLVTKIKAVYLVQDLAASLTKLQPSDQSGRWWKARCPLHDDHNPSFWLDVERGLWGCHACGIRGDVINLYALAHDLSLQAAIRELAALLEEGVKA